MYPDASLKFLAKQSCSNYYKLLRDLSNHPCCLALGAGVSATVGLPTWALLLKRICYCYFEQWALEISTGKATATIPPTKISIALTNGYDGYIREKRHPEYHLPDEVLYSAEYWKNGR